MKSSGISPDFYQECKKIPGKNPVSSALNEQNCMFSISGRMKRPHHISVEATFRGWLQDFSALANGYEVLVVSSGSMQ